MTRRNNVPANHQRSAAKAKRKGATCVFHDYSASSDSSVAAISKEKRRSWQQSQRHEVASKSHTPPLEAVSFGRLSDDHYIPKHRPFNALPSDREEDNVHMSATECVGDQLRRMHAKSSIIYLGHPCEPNQWSGDNNDETGTTADSAIKPSKKPSVQCYGAWRKTRQRNYGCTQVGKTTRDRRAWTSTYTANTSVRTSKDTTACATTGGLSQAQALIT